MKRNLFLLIFAVTTILLQAQGQESRYALSNPSTATTDHSLNEFIEDLKLVLTNRDTIKIKDFLGDRALYYFEMNSHAPDNLNEHYGKELHDKNSKVWNDILNAIEPGGSKNEAMGFYKFPWYDAGIYKFTDTLVEDHDAAAIIGNNINVRSSPSTNGAIVGNLSWQVVEFDRDFNGNDSWVRISTLDRKIKGYVSRKFVFTPYSLRVIIDEEIAMYKYNNQMFTWNELYFYLIKNDAPAYKNLQDFRNNERKYLAPEDEMISRGWKILCFGIWDC